MLFSIGAFFYAPPKALTILSGDVGYVRCLRFDLREQAAQVLQRTRKIKETFSRLCASRYTVGDCLVSIICRRCGCDSPMAYSPANQPAFVFLFFLPFTCIFPKRPLFFRYILCGKILATPHAGVLHLKTLNTDFVRISRLSRCCLFLPRRRMDAMIKNQTRVFNHTVYSHLQSQGYSRNFSPKFQWWIFRRVRSEILPR